MKKINYVKDIVDNYSTGDVINFITTGLAASVKMFDKATQSQNLAQFGNVATTLAEIYTITNALNEKLNGKDEGTVL